MSALAMTLYGRFKYLCSLYFSSLFLCERLFFYKQKPDFDQRIYSQNKAILMSSYVVGDICPVSTRRGGGSRFSSSL